MNKFVLVGEVCGHFGIKGWVKIKSFMRPRAEITRFSEWFVYRDSLDNRSHIGDVDTATGEVDIADGVLEPARLQQSKEQGRHLIAKLAEFDSREQTERLIGAKLFIEKAALVPVQHGEHYWSDLIGLNVMNRDGINLGCVDHIVETGANDVLVIVDKGESVASEEVTASSNKEQVHKERLVPWNDQVIVDVDIEQSIMVVDWDADF